MAETTFDGGAPFAWRRLGGLTVVSLRWFGDDAGVRQSAQALGLAWPQAPCTFAGADPVIAWRSPQEAVGLGMHGTPLRALVDEWTPGRHALAAAFDRSDASAVWSLEGPRLDEALYRLVDAASLPRETGSAHRCRLADVAVMLLRRDARTAWLMADRPVAAFVEDWLAYAGEGALGKGG